MACPPKFNDLHKSADDCFNKDYVHGFFNLKLGQKYDSGSWGNGAITSKWNFNHHAAKSSTELEFKHNNNYAAFPGSVTTKTINIDTGILKYKHELPVNGGKIIVNSDFDTANNFNLKNNSFEFQTGRDRISASLKLNQAGGITNMFNSVNAQAVIGVTKGVNLAGDVNYNVKKGSISHHVKLVSTMNGANVSLNLKNAEDSEMVVSKAIGKSFSVCPSAAFNVKNIHAKAQYGIKSSEYGCQVAIDGNWDCGAWSTSKSTIAWDCKTNDAKFSDHVKLNDSLTGIFSLKTNFNDGFFKKCSVGMALNFNA